jgi:8-oxo-dGTP pyrophosphatase MutT (NUDIX family)
MANSAVITLDTIRTALDLDDFDPEAAHLVMFPGTRPRENGKTEKSRQAGVLVLLYPENGEWCFVLTRRTDHLRGHSGQISFPGGRRDPDDRTFVDTALRETCEELGVCDPNTNVLGGLTPIYIPPSDFEVYPIVAALDYPPRFQPNPDEVAEVFAVTVSALVNDAYKRVEQWPFNGAQVNVPYYAFNGHKVWGATAIMLSELEARLRAVLPQDVNP